MAGPSEALQLGLSSSVLHGHISLTLGLRTLLLFVVSGLVASLALRALHAMAAWCSRTWLRSEGLKGKLLPRVCKVIAEPVGRTPAEQGHLNALRLVSATLGGPWMPRLPVWGLDQMDLGDHEGEGPAVEDDPQLFSVRCVVLKHDFCPECHIVELMLPTT